jgi:hypothetical protein
MIAAANKADAEAPSKISADQWFADIYLAMQAAKPVVDSKVVEVLRIMAKQILPCEMDEDDLARADWQEAYVQRVKQARAILAKLDRK